MPRRRPSSVRAARSWRRASSFPGSRTSSPRTPTGTRSRSGTSDARAAPPATESKITGRGHRLERVGTRGPRGAPSRVGEGPYARPRGGPGRPRRIEGPERHEDRDGPPHGGEDGGPRPDAEGGGREGPPRVVQPSLHGRLRRRGPEREVRPRDVREEVGDGGPVLREPEPGPRPRARHRRRRRRGPRPPLAHETTGPAEERPGRERGDDAGDNPSPGDGAGGEPRGPGRGRERREDETPLRHPLP